MTHPTLSNLIERKYFTRPFQKPIFNGRFIWKCGGSISSGTYTIPIRNPDGMFLDSSDNELYVIIRYKHDLDQYLK